MSATKIPSEADCVATEVLPLRGVDGSAGGRDEFAVPEPVTASRNLRGRYVELIRDVYLLQP